MDKTPFSFPTKKVGDNATEYQLKRFTRSCHIKVGNQLIILTVKLNLKTTPYFLL